MSDAPEPLDYAKPEGRTPRPRRGEMGALPFLALLVGAVFLLVAVVYGLVYLQLPR